MRVRLILILAASCHLAVAQLQTGKASFYADSFEGSPTASGEKYRAAKFTAAHRTLPFGTVLRVTNVANNQTVEVTVNDRGPFVEGRILDLSKAAAQKLGFVNQGVAEVRVEVIDAGNGKGKTQPVVVDHVTVEEREFYSFDVNKIDPKGFGVQLGTYQELANLFRITDQLKSKYKKRTTVWVKVVNGVKYYSLIVGPFGTSAKAESFMDGIKKQFPDAFVLDYSRK